MSTFLLIACALIIGGIYHSIYRARALKSHHSQISSASQIFASTLSSQWKNIYPHKLQDSLDSVASLPEFAEFETQFRVQLNSNNNTILLAQSGGSIDPIDTNNEDFFTLNHPIYNEHGKAIARLYVTGNRGILETELTTAYSIETSFALFFVFLIGYLGYKTAKRFTKPLTELVKGTSKLEEGLLGYKIKQTGHDEFGILVDSFNSMSGALDRARKKQDKDQKALLDTQQELIEARDKSELSAKAKAAFIANISHEIRTPINGIIGLSDILIEHCASDEQRRLLDTIVNSSNSLMGIVNDVLDFSKIEAGKMELDPVPIDLKEFLNDLSLFYQPLAASKLLTMIAKVDDRIPDKLLCDGLRLRQVLTNLLSNALKFTKKGRISLTSKVITVNNTTVSIKISVQDSGIGIDKKQQEKLFKAFTQADESTTREFGGTGLGLVISESIIEKMGSRISLISKPGRGSTFSFCIPFKIPSEEDLKKDIEIQNHNIVEDDCLKGTYGLIADDSKVNRIAIEHQMTKLGCQFDLVEDGLQAFEAATKNNYDFILMDVSMPNMDGLQATQKIREIEKNAQHAHSTPIIAMTANAFSEQKEACLKAGMDDFLTKPAKLYQIAEKIIINLGKCDNSAQSRVRVASSSNSRKKPADKRLTKAKSKEHPTIPQTSRTAPRIDSDNTMNFDFLDELETVYGHDIWESIIDEFLQEGEHTFRNIQEGYDNKDFSKLASYSHKFKGEIGIIGFKKLGNLLEELQHIEKQPIDAVALKGKVEEVTKLYELLVGELSIRSTLTRN